MSHCPVGLRQQIVRSVRVDDIAVFPHDDVHLGARYWLSVNEDCYVHSHRVSGGVDGRGNLVQVDIDVQGLNLEAFGQGNRVIGCGGIRIIQPEVDSEPSRGGSRPEVERERAVGIARIVYRYVIAGNLGIRCILYGDPIDVSVRHRTVVHYVPAHVVGRDPFSGDVLLPLDLHVSIEEDHSVPVVQRPVVCQPVFVPDLDLIGLYARGGVRDLVVEDDLFATRNFSVVPFPLLDRSAPRIVHYQYVVGFVLYTLDVYGHRLSGNEIPVIVRERALLYPEVSRIRHGPRAPCTECHAHHYKRQ